MARARNIKPSFFQNEELGELTPLERLAFIGMWTIADFKGCLELKLKRLKVQLLPYDECDFELIAINLDKSGLIRIYSVQGQRYIKIVNFEKHQNPHKNEREAGSDIPDFVENSNNNSNIQDVEINPDKNGTTRADSLLLIPDSGFPLTDSTEAPDGAMSGKPDDSPKASEKSQASKAHAIEVLQFLNTKATRNYRPTDSNLSLIVARMKEGYTPQDCKSVIAKKCREWLTDDMMNEYLRPATLFNREKFNQYIGEIVEVEDEQQLS